MGSEMCIRDSHPDVEYALNDFNGMGAFLKGCGSTGCIIYDGSQPKPCSCWNNRVSIELMIRSGQELAAVLERTTGKTYE